jgi:hypothetical protein
MNKRIFPTKNSQRNFVSHNSISSRETCDMNNSCVYVEKHEMARSHLGHGFRGSLGLGSPYAG